MIVLVFIHIENLHSKYYHHNHDYDSFDHCLVLNQSLSHNQPITIKSTNHYQTIKHSFCGLCSLLAYVPLRKCSFAIAFGFHNSSNCTGIAIKNTASNEKSLKFDRNCYQEADKSKLF